MVTATRLLPRCDINMLVLRLWRNNHHSVFWQHSQSVSSTSLPRIFLHGQLSRGSVRDNPPIVAKRQVEATSRTNIVPRDARILSPGLAASGIH